MNNRPTPRLICLFLACLLTALIAGCGGPRQPVVYYNLTPVTVEPGRQGTSGPQEPMAIGIGPVIFPDALNRAQIASRLDPQRLQYSDVHRWSGSLADNFASVLMEDIAAQLPATASVALFPWGGYFQPTRRLYINVSRFDGKFHDEAVLEARWSLTNATGKETILSRKSVLQVKVAANNYQDLVSAQSQAVADLAKEIVAALAGR